MTVEAQVEAEIRRLHFVEHWPVGTISKQLAVHADVVRRVVGLFSPRRKPAPRSPLLCAPFAEFIGETLARYPRLCATRLFDMVRERGYTGSLRTLREYAVRVRPAPRQEAFLRVESLVGEQAQVDWAHIGNIAVDGGHRALWVFVLVLAWSRAMWAELVFDLTAVSLCRSLVRAAEALGGCPRQWLFDNPKTVVLERHGAAARFHPALLDLSKRLHVQPRLCAVRRPQHKGKVERSIRYLRDRFLAGRTIASVESGNQELRQFIERIAHQRPHPRFPSRTVAECLAEERGRLLPLSQPPPVTNLVLPVTADKTAYVSFDRNKYSVPWKYAEKALTIVADDIEVRIVDDTDDIATHLRCWGKDQWLEQWTHHQKLVEQRKSARAAKGRDLLRSVAPRFDSLCERWVEDGRNVGSMTARTVKLLDLYGPEIFEAAIADLLARGAHDVGALAHLCEQRRRARALPVPLAVQLPSHAHDREVVPHSLAGYDNDDDNQI